VAGKVRVKERDVNVEETVQATEAAALVNYTAAYAQYVEFPTSYTGPKPPLQPLLDWVSRKWNDLSRNLKTDSQGAPLTERQVAFKVQSIIYQNGTEGVYFGRRGLDAAEQAAPTIAAQYEGSGRPKAGKKIVAEVAKTGFNKSQAIIAQEATDTGKLGQSGSVEIFDSPSELPSGAGRESGGGGQ
jgi:hypothetical protein